jgi:DNA-binding FadR family transcriptional regulator
MEIDLSKEVLPPKEVSPLVANAVSAVREMLGVSSYIQGGRLPAETQLAVRIGVSRPVLRQALAVLKSEGVIKSTRGSGTYVCGELPSATHAPETFRDLESCMKVRMVLETAAAEEAARNANAATIAEIRKALETLDPERPQSRAAIDADMAFHAAIARASGNRYYPLLFDILQPHIALGLKLARQLQSIPLGVTSHRVAAEHRAIFHAISHRDHELASKRMREHLAAGLERIFGRRAW